MAQWHGQFSGLTHGTKLADAEATFRTALASFRAATSAESNKKAEAVRRLAARVLRLRVKLLKAWRNEGGPSDCVARAEQLQTAGVDGILAELGAVDVPH